MIKHPPILVGEQRRPQRAPDKVLTAYRVLPRRVYWLSNDGINAWNGTAKWRSYELVSSPTQTNP